MIGQYSFIVVTLLLHYSHARTQCPFTTDESLIGKELREEVSVNDGTQVFIDILCDRITAEEKRDLCEGMQQAIIYERDIRGADEWDFVPKSSTLPIPKLVDINDPYTCKSIRVEGVAMEKAMFWCGHRVYQKKGGEETQAEGFFISSGLKTAERAFLFRPPTPDSKTVVAFAQMDMFDIFHWVGTENPELMIEDDDDDEDDPFA